jgi:uncharacterized protein (TIGR00251 family)
MSSAGTVAIVIELQPAASSAGILAINQWRQRLQVRVKSPASKGAANQELIALMATIFDLPNSSVILDSGAKDRRKRILLSDISITDVTAIITQALEN